MDSEDRSTDPASHSDDAEMLPQVFTTAASGDTAGEPRSPVWWREVPRWLATLNSGRTQREYEKAVSYFFQTPGVPEELRELTFDLLLAYRGALAVRATPPERGRSYQSPLQKRKQASHQRSLGTSMYTPKSLGDPDQQAHQSGKRRSNASEASGSPLAPATVNIRLTALRQFLTFCIAVGSIDHLTPDRVRMALRRLQIERRRPYQVLAEPEWEDFLRIAAIPATRVTAPTPGDKAHSQKSGPWGISRAERAAQIEKAAITESSGDEPDENDLTEAHDANTLVRARSGLTGKYTAERDHALLALALATGLRAIELSLLDVGDLTRDSVDNHDEWWLILPDAKTKGQHGGRTLPLASSTVQILMTYIAATARHWVDANDRLTPLFVSGRVHPSSGAHGAEVEEVPSLAYTRLSPGHIRRIVDRVETQWRAARGESGGRASDGETRAISPHALRHSTAVALLEGNKALGRPPASVEHVRGWLGHFDIRTTQGYLAHLESKRNRKPFTLAVEPGLEKQADSITE